MRAKVLVVLGVVALAGCPQFPDRTPERTWEADVSPAPTPEPRDMVSAGDVSEVADVLDAGMPDADMADAQVPDVGAPDMAPAPRWTAEERRGIVHLFEWPWAAIAEECEDRLGPAGVRGVQVSPPHEHARLTQKWTWYDRYQPVAYAPQGRGGGREAFSQMIGRCGAAGVEVYVDVVLNHMSFGTSGVGWAGTSHSKYEYPGLYGSEHFHGCRQGIDYGSDTSIWECELSGLPDLDTGHPHVRETLRGYLSDLVSLGVAGVRVDAAKHIAPDDLGAILGVLPEGFVVYQEIIGGESGPVRASQYYGLGRVTDFNFGQFLSDTFRSGQLATLSQYSSTQGLLPPANALSFVDNHDNQRGHGAGNPLTFKNGALHRIATIFTLGWPHGVARVMSSYAFEGGDDGAPRDPDGSLRRPRDPETGACAPGWACEHRQVLGMFGWRAVVGDAPVGLWWSNGNDRVSWSRGGRGFMAINREEAGQMDETLETGLPEGAYCDVLTGGVGPDGACQGRTIEVDGAGRARVVVGPVDAVAIHVRAQPEP